MPSNEDIIALYSRKSKFTGKGESIGNQVELCREYVRLHFGEAAADRLSVYEDEGFSGGNLNRPAFKRMMDAARKRSFRAIIVYRLDRISRNVSDFSGLIEELSRLNIAFISIREQFDTSTPMGRAMMYIASVFSQLERETIAERIRDNMHELAKTGRWLGGTTPTGFASEAVKSVTVDGKTKKACALKLVPEEAELVKAIYDMYLETDSLAMTEAETIRQGFKTKNGKLFSRFSVKAILQNPVYLTADEDAYDYFRRQDADLFSPPEDFDGLHGVMAYNRTDQEKGRATVFLPPSEWIVAVGKHPGLIPGKVWVQIQESLERNRAKSYRKPRSNQALLTGLLYCQCGERMYPKLSQRQAADGKAAYTYVCKLKERSRRAMCDTRNVSGNALDAAVLEQLKRLEGDSDAFVQQLSRSRGFCADSHSARRADELRREKAECERKLAALVDSLADLTDSPARARVTERIGALHEECQSLEAHIQECLRQANQQALSDAEFEMTLGLLASFRAGVDDMSVEQRRAAVRALVSRVVWDGVNAHVTLYGAPDAENACPPAMPPWGEDSK